MGDQHSESLYQFSWHRFVRNLPSLILFNLLIGLTYSAVTMNWAHLGVVLVTSQSIGLSIYLCISTLHRLFLRWHLQAPLGYALSVLLGIPAGFALGSIVPCVWIGVKYYIPTLDHLWNSLTFSLLGGCFGVFYFAGKARYLEARQRAEQASRAAVEAQLRGLQAQVEPHFLFNTLATLDALIAIDPKHARELLGHLNRYLRSALIHSRNTHTTLGEECELLRAYLQIMETRIPNRLRTHIECPADCVELPLAPMLLQPLVENAIKHGIEPAPQGGEIRIHVQRQDDLLIVEVSDTGIGLAQSGSTQGTGTGLANIRERLLALYGKKAQLTLAPLSPHGTLARIAIPMTCLQEQSA
ncbi:sensor histidine kinase [Uliginosibacterium gangwonense]|uniref:sensor histidine kinase n=1 Tax=Uliginosibacterium gangwonense TaxID=392736 RepID=UPI0003A2B4D6|nr:histidine kinase [Uliginosibacterium gangwonense]